MARAHVYKVLINSDGSVLTGASVQVNDDAGGATSQTLYANETGSTALANPFVSASGVVEFWLNNPERLVVVFTPSGGSPTSINVDAFPSAAQIPIDASGTLTIANAPFAGWVLTGLDTGDAQWQAVTQDLVSSQETGAWTLISGQAYQVVEINSAAAATVTVPPNSTQPMNIGTVIEVVQMGAGQVTIAPGAGVTLRAAGGALKLSGQYASCSLRKRATNEWVVIGSLTT